jgi:hypothetical protein
MHSFRLTLPLVLSSLNTYKKATFCVIMLFHRFIMLLCIMKMITGFPLAASHLLGRSEIMGKHRRILTLANEHVAALSTVWWNWNYCTNAYVNESFTPMNSIVPNDTLFLAGYPTSENNTANCSSKTITRTANINVGAQTIIYPLVNQIYIDYEDDYELGICANSTNETLANRLDAADALSREYTSETYIMSLYSNIDSIPVTPTYIYSTEAKYFTACPNNAKKTTEEIFTTFGFPEGDTCDKEPFQLLDGLDAYPTLGWYGVDIRTWKDGETHTYEFGTLEGCYSAKYVLTAVGSPDSTTSNDRANQTTGDNSTSDSNYTKIPTRIAVFALFMSGIVSVGFV